EISDDAAECAWSWIDYWPRTQAEYSKPDWREHENSSGPICQSAARRGASGDSCRLPNPSVFAAVKSSPSRSRRRFEDRRIGGRKAGCVSLDTLLWICSMKHLLSIENLE